MVNPFCDANAIKKLKLVFVGPCAEINLRFVSGLKSKLHIGPSCLAFGK